MRSINQSTLFFIILAGQPPTIQLLGTSLTTKEFVAIMAFKPTVTPFKIVPLFPIQTCCSIITLLAGLILFLVPAIITEWESPVLISISFENKQSDPTIIDLPSVAAK